MDIVLLKGMQEALLITINEMIDNLENRDRRLTANDQFLLNKAVSLRRFYNQQIKLIDMILTRGVER